MNIPNRMNANTRFAPGNRQRASTNPFTDPIIEEMIAAGTASNSDRIMYGFSTSQALLHGSSVQVCGKFHCAAAVVSLDVLKLPTTTTYTGIRTNSRKNSSRRYLTDRLSRVVPSAPVRGFRLIAVAVVPVAASTAVIRCSPDGRCTRRTG
jgi:hypothetical protein